MTNCGHRFEALKRIGHDPVGCDLHAELQASLTGPIGSRFHVRTGYRCIQKRVATIIKESALFDRTCRFDLIWVNSGELIGPSVIKILQEARIPIVLYNNDDPTNGRDGRRWESLIAALPEYDLVVVCRESTRDDLQELTAKPVFRVWMSYDEVCHSPDPQWEESPEIDVAFIGTWMRGEEREKYLRALHESGIKVRISGGRWSNCPDRSLVDACWDRKRYDGLDYVNAISVPRVTLGLLSKGNRDLHTRRSVEVPYAGGLLCAERTKEHQQLYKEDEEAVFWSSPEECVAKCKWLLENPDIRQSIRHAGRERVLGLGVGNESLCSRIIELVNQPNRHLRSFSQEIPSHESAQR